MSYSSRVTTDLAAVLLFRLGTICNSHGFEELSSDAAAPCLGTKPAAMAPLRNGSELRRLRRVGLSATADPSPCSGLWAVDQSQVSTKASSRFAHGECLFARHTQYITYLYFSPRVSASPKVYEAATCLLSSSVSVIASFDCPNRKDESRGNRGLFVKVVIVNLI